MEIDKKALLERIDEALESVRPHLRLDGGNVEVVDVDEDMVVSVRWLGNCQGCDMSDMTMRAGIEEALRRQVPEVSAVKAINSLPV